MRRDPIHSYRDRIKKILKTIEENRDNTDIQSHLSNYLCILLSGYLEVSCRAIFNKYTKNKSNPNISEYVSNNLEGFQNPNFEKIRQLVNSFDFNWIEDLENNSIDFKDAVDSVVDNRHRLAHGKDSNISFNRVQDYYNRIDKMIDVMKNKVDYNTTP